MVNSKKMKVILVGIVIAFICMATSYVLATDSGEFQIPSVNNNTTNQPTNNTVGNNTTTNIAISNTTTTPATTNNNTSTYSNQNLPKTGVTDGYFVAILVAVCAVAAVYAYKKVRDYQNIK